MVGAAVDPCPYSSRSTSCFRPAWPWPSVCRMENACGHRDVCEPTESERRTYNGGAKMHFGVGSLPRDCMIIDVSDGGARILAENLEVPAEFTLIFSTGQSRRCRLAWRIGCEFGGEFIDQGELHPRHRTARAG